jgi:glycosyltransferase involved in cell wall biosynthesis
MIHFIEKAAPGRSTLALELKRLGPHLLVLGRDLDFHFRSRARMLLQGYPRLFWFSLRLALQSLAFSKPAPKTVVLHSDIEIIVFSAIRSILFRNTAIVFQGFIYTQRRSGFHRRLRHMYYSFILSRTKMVICHSRLETERYATLFPHAAERFVFVPWGGQVYGWDSAKLDGPAPAAEGRRLKVLAVGRSGRDYPTLIKAVAGEPVDVTILCDQKESLSGVSEAPNTRILRDCYGACYLDELRSCDVVVVPLAVHDISAGQMTIIQAMAYGKPVIASRTPTVEDYVTDGQNGLLVELGSPDALRAALRRLHQDGDLYLRIQRAAHASYVGDFSQAAAVQNLVRAVERA